MAVATLHIGISEYPDEVSPNMFSLRTAETYSGPTRRAEITLNKSNDLKMLIMQNCGISEKGAEILMNEIVDAIPDSPVDTIVGEAELDDDGNILGATIQRGTFADTLQAICGKTDLDETGLLEWYNRNEELYSGSVSWLQYVDFYRWFNGAGVQLIQNKAEDFAMLYSKGAFVETE